MGTDTKIEWASHSFSPWRGCSKVSPGCDLCYAEAQSHRNPRVLGIWGDEGTRPAAAAAYWRNPIRWDDDAALEGVRKRVFCGSLMDFFEDRDELLPLRERALNTARYTVWLDWLFLTKRPENGRRLLARAPVSGENPGRFTTYLALQEASPLANFWMGCTVESQTYAHARIGALLSIPAAVHFLSCEPLLGPLDLSPWLGLGVGWVIVGGESNQGGKKARSMHLEWVEEIIGQCRAAQVPCFVKQMGSNPVCDSSLQPLRLLKHHGGDPEEWPPWLRVREFPVVPRMLSV